MFHEISGVKRRLKDVFIEHDVELICLIVLFGLNDLYTHMVPVIQ